MIFKYVMLVNREAILFSVALEHSKMQGLGKITSAGFVDLADNFKTFGKSMSLDLEPDPKDSRTIKASASIGDINYASYKDKNIV